MSERTAARLRRRLAEHSRRIVDSSAFTATVFCLIATNAALLGIETYTGVVHQWHAALKAAEHVFLVAFTAEILLRAAAHADRPGDFFRDPWNTFDLLVVTTAFMPFARENATVLRLLRLARVLRAARFLPQLRIVIVAVGKSLPGTLSFLLVGALLLYVYAMVGWVFFADDDPEHYGSLGRAVLTLFLLMTLDGLGDAVRAGLEISRWSIVYFASFVLLGSFVLVNLLIGVVINSLQEASDLEAERDRPVPAQPTPTEDANAALRARIADARRTLDELEAGLEPSAPTRR
ncbi:MULTISPECIES: ion transporter [Streptomyces]|uniref:Ion transporter n=1 Tax=Streptomyces glycanivorans TaxID=3033808 RepID=A0ABY9J4E1_9ACTN|nr:MULTISPECIES: ion transporter [unclassified Streptomyces]WSQ76033.1 ion transporter [Streptomyces sp. NBC_01213]TXS15221.1 ion transporter [Streptomyces sp. wa22]WLQ62522.1 ion transporter [Streptomyces sp. Alt3]WSQ83279.1 ion transporter [Streptomyces sp. NBC_01212]WSR10690.1 ion transporter [Streptomyces sp. NBC_01208]